MTAVKVQEAPESLGTMDTVQALLSLLSVISVSEATYKQWIPNTNFENAANWREQRVPCAQDTATFLRDQRVSVFVQSSRPLTNLFLPLDGEFILSPGAGFLAASRDDPECGQGTSLHFHDVDRFQWFDPTLWRSALSTDDLDTGRFLFAVDAECVPCRYDDVIFAPETSFRVQLEESRSDIQLRSLSVLGRKFTSNEDFSQYLKSPTGRLQFPGPAQPQITSSRCQDTTGCLCGNDEMLQEICTARLQYTGAKCPEATCANPLHPVGHCCGICGVIVNLEYSSAFNLETYRSRLLHMFLSLRKYSSVKLAISKVQSSSPALSVARPSAEPKIQIILIDEKEGSLAGSDALQLGYDIMADVETNGESFGIIKAEMLFATGGVTSPQKGAMSAGAISGIVIGIVLGLSLIGASYFLYRMDACRFRYTQFFNFGRNESRMEDVASENQGGFDNPIFEPESENNQAAPIGEEILKEVALQESGFSFSNPVFNSDFQA
ncbi:protein amnionless-like [Bufo gargarizans]|uniref:protein amnionless-like n=1 Tax=Bufo gargarizans TaxID=30331 RepID=UPI001CF19A6D|nr:protein amnionless-like [Bufo gargarizans]XP_044127117.1 protein amnionless-like [Bufo gargarizans]XP_044127118.1 protein amnionless-like [Bufo gargarizans]